MQQAFPEPATPETEEGVAAHWVFERLLRGTPTAEGEIAPNGVPVTVEMLDGADFVLDYVRANMAGRELNIEAPIACPSIHSACWGTPDLWGVDLTTFTLDVLDYKFGHRFVDEFENWQGIAYISGIVDKLAAQMGVAPGAIDQQLTVRFTVIQPRCYYRGAPVRTWTVNAAALRGLVNQLAYAAAEAMKPNAPATPGEHCRDCAGRHACDALQKAGYKATFESTRATPFVMAPAAASLELLYLQRAEEVLKARIAGLEEQVAAFAKQGAPVPFHALEKTPGRTVWKMSPEEVATMCDLMGVNVRKLAVVTPKQAKALGVDETVISAYSDSSGTKISLVQSNPADARRVFGLLEQ